MFTSSSMAASAAASYNGELGQGFRVKRLSSSTSNQSSTPPIKSLQVSPKPPKQAPPNESTWVEAYNNPLPTKGGLAPLKTPPSSSYDSALNAANALLEQSGGGGTSPVVERFNKVEMMGREQSSAATIEKVRSSKSRRASQNFLTPPIKPPLRIYLPVAARRQDRFHGEAPGPSDRDSRISQCSGRHLDVEKPHQRDGEKRRAGKLGDGGHGAQDQTQGARE